MTLSEIRKKLVKLKNRGFIPTLRRGPTGIGYTLERELGLTESNVAIPDLGGRVELKSSRRVSSSLITLFTFNRGVWQIPQRKVIENYGYIDENGRRALYNTIWMGRDNTSGLSVLLDKPNNQVKLIHTNTNELIAKWSIFVLVGKFLSKLERLIFVLADSRINEENKEEFHFNEAYYLEDASHDNFFTAFNNSKIGIDIRMHLKENNVVRNHGTGIRIHEKDIMFLYENKRKLL